MSRLAILGTAVCLAAASAVGIGAQADTGPPGFVVAAAPSSLYSYDYANEPSIGANWRTGTALYQSLTSTYKLRFDNTKTPPAVSWSDVSSPYSHYNIDPILATDAASGTALAGGDDGSCAVMSKTQDDGESWSLSLPCTVVVDHPNVGIGPLRGGGGVGAYFCQTYPLAQCTHSTDGGASWLPSAPAADCGGSTAMGHVRVAPDGTVYVPSRDCFPGGAAAGVGGLRSVDNGATWQGYLIPGTTMPSRGFDPAVAIGTDGRLWETWSREGDWHPVVASSGDGGKTWSKVTDLAGTVSPGLVGSAFPVVVAGSGGRVAVAYLGTSTGTKGQTPYDEPNHDAVWHLYISTTYDGGASWQTARVTDDPVQRGGINDQGVGSAGARNLYDFMDATLTRDGRVLVGFADGCVGECAGPKGTWEQSTKHQAVVAYQSDGTPLFDDADLARIRDRKGFAAR